ncbi:MAG: hypothetical protein ABR991_03730 [Terracidiphilus sp.]
MDLFKMEMRHLFGLLVPGALFLMAIGFAVATSPFTHNCWNNLDEWSKGHEVLAITISFSLSYLSGSLFRLNSADNLDKLSGWANEDGTKVNSSDIDIIWNNMTSKPIVLSDPEKVKRLWSSDLFPYPVFQLWRIIDKCPKDDLAALEPLLTRMKSGLPDKGRKSPFNYCKTVVFSAAKELGEELIREIRSKETEVRFFAGTFYALVLGIVILILLFLSQIASLLILKPFIRPASIWEIVASFVIASILVYANWKIMFRFRTLRIREVDIVLDAYALGISSGYITLPIW